MRVSRASAALSAAMSLTTQTIDNASSPLVDFLRAELRGSYEFMAASAFLNSRGLGMIKRETRDILEGEGRVSIVHGADFRIADPFEGGGLRFPIF